MKRRTSEEIRNHKIIGAIAESIFVQMHEELGCLVIPGGVEHTHRNLYHLMNLKRNFEDKKGLLNHMAHKLFSETLEGMYEESNITPQKNTTRKKETIKEIEKLLKTLHYQTKNWSEDEINSSPDFTVVNKSGMVFQFEVKYRSNGILEEKYSQRYLENHPHAHVFLIHDKKPHVKIYSPITAEIKGEQLYNTFETILEHPAFREFNELTKNETKNSEKIDTLRKENKYFKAWDDMNLLLKGGCDLGNNRFSNDFSSPGMKKGVSKLTNREFIPHEGMSPKLDDKGKVIRPILKGVAPIVIQPQVEIRDIIEKLGKIDFLLTIDFDLFRKVPDEYCIIYTPAFIKKYEGIINRYLIKPRKEFYKTLN